MPPKETIIAVEGYENGNITEPNEIACTLQKKRIECAIMIQADDKERGHTSLVQEVCLWGRGMSILLK